MDINFKLNETIRFLKSFLNNTPDIAVVLGSNGEELKVELENKIEVYYSEIPNFTDSSIHKNAKLIFGDYKNKSIVYLCGRTHYYEGYEMQDITFPIRVLKLLGVEKIILTNASGGINPTFKMGDIMIINDHINLGPNPLRGKNLDQFGERFPDLSRAYTSYIDLCKNVANKLDIDIKEGVYAFMQGPSYETPAEIKMLGIMGADVVGMSTVSEVIVAHHCGMKVLGLSIITNMASGISKNILTHKEVLQNAKKTEDKFKSLLEGIINNI